MGMFDKFKNLLQNVDKSEIKEKMASTMDSLKDKVEAVKSKAEKQINDANFTGNSIGGIVKKGISKLETTGRSITENVKEHNQTENKNENQEVEERNIIIEESSIANHIESSDSSEDKDYENKSNDLEEDYIEGNEQEEEENQEDEEYLEEEVEEESQDDDDENDDDEDEAVLEEKSKKQKKVNKKALKNLAKGAMFVGSFLYTQKYENADSGAALLHAFKKTKEVDDMFDKKAGWKSEKKSSKKEKTSSENKIRSIARYRYICPKNQRGHSYEINDIEIPTVSQQGLPTNEEAVAVLVGVLGVSEGEARSIWHGRDNLKWKLISYTCIDEKGRRGTTIKCK